MDMPLISGILNETECEITSKYDATALLEKLKAGVWTVEEVTVAFCKRAAVAHQLVRSFISSTAFDLNLKSGKKDRKIANFRFLIT